MREKGVGIGLVILTGIFLLGLLIFLKGKEKQEKKMINETISAPTRPAAVAGTFYPDDPKVLETQLKSFLEKAQTVSIKGVPRILIVPHAGIIYSGQTAAWGFKQIQNQNYSKVILLGSSHQSWFNHAAVYASGAWETPLGKVAIDQKLAQKIVDKEKNILADTQPHLGEHSLEVELIFLQTVLGDFKILPILVSNPNGQLVEDLAEKIAQNMDERTLLVISTDLSHYPPYQIAQQADAETIEAILTGNHKEFEKRFQQILQKGYRGLETPACGHEAVKVGLRVGEILGLKYQKLFYQNSGDTAGDKSRVVGYVSIIGWEEKTEEKTEYLDEKAQKEALMIARETLRSYLKEGSIPQFSTQNQSLNKKLGAFVTLRKNGQLRGCIGSFEPDEPLYKVIQKMAIAAATEDLRFPPVTFEELKDIKIEISVLTPKKKINDWRKIKLGRDGVVIQKGNRTGTFLPQVATETGWDLEEFLSQLCFQKAGLPPDCYKDPDTTIYVFQAQVFEEE